MKKRNIDKLMKIASQLAEKEIKLHIGCGCQITIPHSHLIKGHQCECERGLER